MLEHLDMAIGFTVVMLAVSLLITVLVQTASALLGLRGTNLRWGVEALLRTVYPQLGAQAGSMADRILQHPLISDSTLSRFTGVLSVPVVGRWIRRLHYAKAIRLQELVAILGAVAGPPSAMSLIAPVSQSSRVFDAPSGVAHEASSESSAAPGVLPPDVALPNDKLQFWFDSTMDRVSQRFAVQMRVWTVAFSIIVAFALHLDAFRLMSQMSSAPEARARLATAAESLERAAEGVTTLRDRPPTGNADVHLLTDQAVSIRTTLAQAGFQLVPDPYHSWDISPWWPTPVWAGPRPATAVNFLYDLFFVRPANLHFWGILFSAGLLSLGAPFWFNALKSLGALKPVVANKEDEERTSAGR